MKNATNVSNVVARVSDDVVKERKVYTTEVFFFSALLFLALSLSVVLQQVKDRSDELSFY
jgi:hypothetical protein